MHSLEKQNKTKTQKEGILPGKDLKENTNGKEKGKQDPSVPNDNTSPWTNQVTGQWVICFCLLSSFLRRDAIKILIWSDIKRTFSLTLINYLGSIFEIPFPPSSSEAGYVGIFPKTLIDKVIWSEILITFGIYYKMEKRGLWLVFQTG